MTRTRLAGITLAAAMMAVLLPSGRTAAHGGAGSREVVIEWNEILQGTIPSTAALQAPRYYAMLHVAIFDAVNSIERDYKHYRVRVHAPHGASPEAAAAQAAHDVLAALFPTSLSTFDAALAARLASIPHAAARKGVQVGQEVAQAVLAWRQDDGWSAPPPAYVLPPFPGLWQPTPPAFSPPTFTQFPSVVPFALLTSTQYLPSGPPTLTSDAYAEAFNEVKLVGSATSSTRTDEQTLLARLFAGVVTRTTLFALWNNVARDTSRAHGLSLVDTARLYALLDVSINDGVQTSHTSKFVYGLWRPVTAIRRADEDLNPETDADPGWLPLLTTPSYPSHSGNQACVAASAARALARAFGTDDVPFTAVWRGTTGNPDVFRDYPGFWAMADEQARSRIYGGIHFTFESAASQASCVKVADYVFGHFMLPRR